MFLKTSKTSYAYQAKMFDEQCFMMRQNGQTLRFTSKAHMFD